MIDKSPSCESPPLFANVRYFGSFSRVAGIDWGGAILTCDSRHKSPTADSQSSRLLERAHSPPGTWLLLESIPTERKPVVRKSYARCEHEPLISESNVGNMNLSSTIRVIQCEYEPLIND